MDSDSAKSHWRNYLARSGSLRTAAAAAVPVALVNITAFIGQFAFLKQHVPWVVPGIVLIAVAIESIAIYLAWHAHLAQLANDSAGRLKLGAYTFALIVGVMNYSHYAAPHWRPTVMAVIMFFASALSPWLWGIHTRRASRDQLMAQGLVEPHAVRLGANRWMWHAIRSWRAMYWATWHGENDPKIVMAHFAPRYGTVDTPAPVRQAVPAQVRQAVPVAVPVPEIEAASVPHAPAGPVQPTPGTEVNGQRVDGEAFLEAGASLGGDRGVSPETRTAAELYLASLSYEQARDISVRKIARDLLHDENQRRLADRLKRQRLAAEPPKMQAPAREMNGAGHTPVMMPGPGGGVIG